MPSPESPPSNFPRRQSNGGQYGASFRFQTRREEFELRPGRSAHNPEGIPERTITEADVFEFGPVVFPAYKDATASVRSTAYSIAPVVGDRIEHVGCYLGRGPDPLTLRRLRKAATRDGGAASLLRALERGERIELNWNGQNSGHGFERGRVLSGGRGYRKRTSSHRLPSSPSWSLSKPAWHLP